MTTTVQSAELRILLGPSYLSELEQVSWPSATVRYLQKYPQRGTAANSIYYDEHTLKRAVVGQTVERGLADLIVRLNHDPNCFFLVERERADLFKGSFLAPVDIADCARYAWAILHSYRPDLVVFHNRPHELFTYVLLKAALHRDIPVLLVHFAALPWRMSISRYSRDAQLMRLRLRQNCSDAERAAVRGYMHRLRQTHEQAIPFADRKLIAAASSPLYLGDELRSALRGSLPKNLLRMWKKWAIYRAFRAFVSGASPDRYVAFLMHYQPEETTIPRGDIYAQQLNALLKLRSVLPPDVSILVKENKATFRAPLVLAMDVRSRDFYRAVSSLPSTFLVPLERDTFDMIDRSVAVATITGSVGLEALCRGKRVIVFGEASYRHFCGVVDLNAGTGEAEIHTLLKGARHDCASTEQDMVAELCSSFGPAAEDNENNLQSQQAATVDAFRYVADNAGRLAVGP